MKKSRLIGLLLTSVLFIGAANSQLFVSGHLLLNTTSSESTAGGTTAEGNSTLNFELVPKVGFFLSDKFAIGMGLGIETGKTTIPGVTETVIKSRDIIINPFARYYFANFGDVSLLAEGGLDLSLGSSKTTAGGISTDGPTETDITIYVAPAISYDLSDNFSIEASIGEISYELKNDKTDVGGVTTEDKDSEFTFRFDISAITFGILYKF